MDISNQWLPFKGIKLLYFVFLQKGHATAWFSLLDL